jgi:hypothetical protein
VVAAGVERVVAGGGTFKWFGTYFLFRQSNSK